jgi:hypothetical protein
MTIMGGTIRGNYIGTNAAGTAAIPNAQGGVRVSNASASRSAVPPPRRATSSRELRNGVGIDGTGGGNAVIGQLHRYRRHRHARRPQQQGVSVSAPNTLIGTTAAGAGNVISGNAFNGIVLGAGGNGCSIKRQPRRHERGGHRRSAEPAERIRAIAVTNATIGDLTAAGAQRRLG